VYVSRTCTYRNRCNSRNINLENLLSSIDEIGYFTFSNNNDVVPPIEARPNSIFVFHDVACDKQDTVREYFSMGRHLHVDCFYLCQSYARIPKHLIWDNANLLILFRMVSTWSMCTMITWIPTCHTRISLNYAAIVGSKSMDSWW